MRLRLLCLVMALVAGAAGARAQDDILARYEPGTLREITRQFISAADKSAAEAFSDNNYLTKVRATFDGASRKVPAGRRAFLEKFLRENHYPPDFLAKFGEEYLFTEGATSYWLVMQDVVTPHLLAEVARGKDVDLYVLLIGVVREGGQLSPVIMVNEFKLPEAQRPSGPRTGKVGWGGAPAEEDAEVIKGFERYRRRTLAEIIGAHDDPRGPDGKSPDMILTGDTFPSRVQVTYTGSTREAGPARRRHFDLLRQSFDIKPEHLKLYETEMLFLEGRDEHWLPVNKQLIPFFEKELKKGDKVTLYTEWVGAQKVNGKWDWIFIVNEFQK